MAKKRIFKVFSSHKAAEQAEALYWRKMTPQERLDAVGECVREYLRLKNEPESGFCRVYRIFEQTRS